MIDNVGYRPKEDSAIYALPKARNVAIIPVAPNATELAKQAFTLEHNVLIHFS